MTSYCLIGQTRLLVFLLFCSVAKALLPLSHTLTLTGSIPPFSENATQVRFFRRHTYPSYTAELVLLEVTNDVRYFRFRELL